MRTVAAISTPYGKGGVALIRITGDEAIVIAEKVAIRTGKGTLADAPSATAVRVTFEDCGVPFDDGLATVFRAPRSFTGEDVVELCCHGGILLTQKLLSAVFAAGAFPAGPGEFTRRAFQNGKLSLSQAEAVGGLIDAKSEQYLTVSLLQCRGALSEKLQDLCGRLRFLIASVYAFIDYPDEDMTDVSVEEMQERLAAICRETETLCDSHAYGKAISEGIPVCILGKPNTGKSALLNALAREERAIVTDIPGTTRDVVKEQVRLGDLLLNLSDTAGIRDSEDVVEQIGIQRSVRSLEEAELVLAMFDGSRPFDDEDEKVLKLIRESGKEEQTVYLMNKSDLQEDASVRTSLPKTPVVISAMEKTGLEALEAAVKERFGHVDTRSLGEIVVGARQFAALTKAKKHMQDALHTLEGFSQDMAGLDMEQALQALEEVDGKTASDEIVSEIFSHFCVGK